MTLLSLLLLFVKYNTPLANRDHTLQEIASCLESSGAVWQKFAQLLSQQEELIGAPLANALGRMCYECPAHDSVHSERKIADAFGGKYDTSSMQLVGSGTIAQVHRVRLAARRHRFVAIKVMHPHARETIRAAMSAYEQARTSMFFPSMFEPVCNYFFDGLERQLCMRTEFKNAKRLVRLLQPDPNGRYVCQIPRMIECSDECLVMQYIPSTLLAQIDTRTIDRQVVFQMHRACSMLLMAMTLCGFMHGDMHNGNIGIVNHHSVDTMRIVLYDFGQMIDVRSGLTREMRGDIVKAHLNKSASTLVRLGCPDEHERMHIITQLSGHYEKDLEQIARRVFISGVQLDPHVRLVIFGWAKQKGVVDLVRRCEVELLGKDSMTYEALPYDEFRSLFSLTRSEV